MARQPVGGPADQFLEAQVAFEDRAGAGHAFAGEHGGEDALAGGVGEGAAFPVGQLPYSGLAQGGAGDAGDVQGPAGAIEIEAHDAGRGGGGGEAAVGDVVPADLAKAGGVAEAALDLVGDDDRGDELAAVGITRFCDGQCGGNVVAGVCGLLGEIRVVVVQIADQAAVGEGGPIHRSAMSRAPEGGALERGDARGDLARDHTRLGVPCAQGAADRVEDPALDLVDNLVGQIFKTEACRIRRHPLRQCCHRLSSFALRLAPLARRCLPVSSRCSFR